jgi:hypothetical protein
MVGTITKDERKKLIADIRDIMDEEISMLTDTIHNAFEEMCRTGNTGIKVYYDNDNMHIQLVLPLEIPARWIKHD